MKVYLANSREVKAAAYPLQWSDVESCEGIYARDSDDHRNARIIVMKSVHERYIHLFYLPEQHSLAPYDVNASHGRLRRTHETIVFGIADA